MKIQSQYFWAVVEGKKKAEFRKNDRDFKVGDMLILKEWIEDEKSFTSNYVVAVVTDATLLDEWAAGFILISLNLIHQFIDVADRIKREMGKLTPEQVNYRLL